MKWCTLLSTLLKTLNKFDNTIFWKTYFSLANSASVTDFHLWRNCMQKFLRITSTTKTGNNTFPTTSTIETADFGHYRFFKWRPQFFKIWKSYHICVFSRHIIDKKLDLVLEFFHRKNCMKKFLQLFSSRILRAKIRDHRQTFLLIRLNAMNIFRFFQV